ncbi:hypothetical protein [Claveliimonas bilis]|uniref:hypothetical protein n=1 Tax=Claveliimonas bilis TaxID=3028070 RepID=UPI002931E37E|nr:hypothetical protein [Claveliimonas bilis]BDZ80959.1 hypothetical protein Lac3_21680 [Claveliimonas bilis]
MASVQDLINSGIFHTKNPGRSEQQITRVFCCDLLSVAMGKAPSGCAWVTVIGNRNTLAVASLADVSCIVLAEGASFTEDDMQCAKEQEIAVFSTDLPVFEAALKVHQLL